MANLSYREKLMFEGLFGMDSGYVLDFSNATFARFIAETINLDIYEGVGYQEYCSKANKLRQIWSKEPDAVVGKLMDELLTYYEDYYNRMEEHLSEQQIKTINELRTVTKKLMGTGITINLPHKSEETLQTLMEDINDSLSRNKPTLVLDRLHTFATKLLRQACIDNDINVVDGKGNYLPLHSLAGMLKKKYEKDQIFESSFTLRALQNSISLFDSYNDIRNTKSYAHDNDILNMVEADFVVKAMANVLTFVDNVENYRKKKGQLRQSASEPFELPF
ncbi:abortive infection family protein [Bacillus sp. IITD106]|nr:abortive infection family protein [Bacillus sp. IITD106]